MHLVDAYLDACVTDVERARSAGLPPATSVFFGGGTPSLVPAAALVRILDHIDRSPGRRGDGRVQPRHSEHRPVAHIPTRRRQPAELRRAVDGAARARVARPHARSGERRRVGARCTRRRVRVVQPRPHLRRRGRDARRLARHPRRRARARSATRRARTASRSSPALRWPTSPNRHPDDDDQADKYVVADRALSGRGLQSYEISNWARPGYECRHNLLYWSQGEYLGIGCAAHSHRDGTPLVERAHA